MSNMEKLTNKVETLVEVEYREASKNHGEKFHSPHEAVGVIGEEFHESAVEGSLVANSLNDFTNAVYQDLTNEQEDALKVLKAKAINAAAELIQVAATAHKALLGYNMNKGKKK